MKKSNFFAAVIVLLAIAVGVVIYKNRTNLKSDASEKSVPSIQSADGGGGTLDSGTAATESSGTDIFSNQSSQTPSL